MRRSAADKRLQIVLDRLTPAAKREILRALDRLQQAASLTKIVDALERGDFWSFERLVEGLPKDLDRATRELRRAFDAGMTTARVEIGASLTAPNVSAAQAAERTAARFVTGVTAETRKAIRTAISQSFTQGRTVREVAKDIKPLIGLADRQVRAVNRYRRDLTAKGAKNVEAKARTYAERLLKQRAELIARTEIIKASTDGKIAAWKDARVKGLLSNRLVKTWIVTPDDRLCPVCAPLDGVQALIDAPFHTSAGDVIGPPAHPRCRCTVGLVEAKQPKRQAA
jgi:SPP1 gp7 family putative phage head morphogenesis protein